MPAYHCRGDICPRQKIGLSSAVLGVRSAKLSVTHNSSIRDELSSGLDEYYPDFLDTVAKLPDKADVLLFAYDIVAPDQKPRRVAYRSYRL